MSDLEMKLNILGKKYLSGNLPLSGIVYENNGKMKDRFPDGLHGTFRNAYSILPPNPKKNLPEESGIVNSIKVLLHSGSLKNLTSISDSFEEERGFVSIMFRFIDAAGLQFMEEFSPHHVMTECNLIIDNTDNKFFREIKDKSAFEIKFNLIKKEKECQNN